jgi:hypothetical protein
MSALPPKADIRSGPRYTQRSTSGSLAIFAAVRRDLNAPCRAYEVYGSTFLTSACGEVGAGGAGADLVCYPASIGVPISNLRPRCKPGAALFMPY